MGALVGVGALALVVHRAAATAGSIEETWRGRFLARLNAGSALVMVGLIVLLYRPWVRAHLSGEHRPAARRWWAAAAAVVLPLWWLSMVVAGALVGMPGGPRQLLITALMLRDPRSTGPLPGLGIGVLFAVVASAAVLMPVWSIVVRAVGERRGPRPVAESGDERGDEVGDGRGAGDQPGDDRRIAARQVELHAAGTLIVAGLVVRAVLGAIDDDQPFGVLSWLPAWLAPVGVGCLLATLIEGRRIAPPGRPDRRLVLASVGVTAVAFALLTSRAIAPLVGEPNGVGQVVTEHLLVTLVAGGIGYFLVHAPNRFVHPTAVILATLAPGWLLFGEPVTDLIARQYRERVTGPAGARLLDGPATPLALWTAVVCGALGVVLVAGWQFGSVRRRRPLTDPVAWRFALGGIGAAAFLWRFVALLGIARERTDGGDPLFYHTTANLLAEGRGFIEPLNWIAHGLRIPSALHGPLYPMVLSISSRLGGVGYFDHKMVSLLVGSATAVVAAQITRRLAGATAGLLAGVLVVIYPNLWVIDGVLFPEGLFALLTSLSILAVLRWRDGEHRTPLALVAGAIVGLAALTRGEGVLLGPLMIVPWFWSDRRLATRARIRQIVVAAVGCLVVIAPWAIRNSAHFNTAVPLSTNGNELLVYANCDETYSGKFLGFWLFDCQDQIRAEIGGEPPGDEAEKSNFWRERGLTYARENVGELPKVVAARVGRQWELFRPWQNAEFAAIEGRSVAWARAGLAMYYVLAAGSIAGFIRLRRRRVPTWPLLAQLMAVTVTAAYAYGTIRFRASAEPVLCMLAAIGFVPAIERLVSWRPTARDSLTAPGALVLGGAGRMASSAGGALARPGGEPGVTRRWRRLAPLAALGVVIVAPLRGLYRSAGSTMEEAFMITFPERVIAGDVPNVDFLHLYGPGSLDVLGVVYRLFGAHLDVERTYGLAQHVSIILAIYAITRAWGRVTAVACASLSAILVLTPIGLSALAWNGGIGLGLWSVVVALRARHTSAGHRFGWELAAGALAGLALTYRPDLAPTLGATHLFLLGRRRDAWRAFIVGALIGLAPMWNHFRRAGFSAAWRGMFSEPVFELRPGRELPRPPAWDYFHGALQVIADKFPPWWGMPYIAGPRQLFLWFYLLPVVALGVLAIGVAAHRWSDDERRTRTLVAAGIFGVGLLPQGFQRPDSAHFAWVSCVSFAVAPVAIAEVLRLTRRARPTGRTALGVCAVAACYLAVFPHFSYRPYLNHVRQSVGQVATGLEVRRGERIFMLGDTRPWRAAQQVVDDLDALAQPGERLFVGPVDLRQTAYSDVFFYTLFPELTPATYFIEMDPGLANAEGSRLAGDVASADWLILTRYWSGWIEPNTSVDFGSDRPNQIVEEQFCMRGSYENDLVRLYERCPSGDGIGPYEGPYEPAFDYAVEVSVPVPPRPDGTSPFAPGAP